MKLLKELLTLKALPGIGNGKINKGLKFRLYEGMSNIELKDEILNLGYSVNVYDVALREANHIIDMINSNPGYNAYTVFDDEYPKRLDALGTTKPVVIYTIGNINLLSRNTLGVVGTVHPDKYVETNSPELIKKTIDISNSVIICGMAKGCDTIGHKTAYEQNSITVGVPPFGFDKANSFSRSQMMHEILDAGGLIISEFTPDTVETKYTPVQRDMIVAALSDRILSLQCKEKSGTMITLKKAYELGKPIGCYMPEIQTGNFSGHYYAISSLNAHGISGNIELMQFLSK